MKLHPYSLRTVFITAVILLFITVLVTLLVPFLFDEPHIARNEEAASSINVPLSFEQTNSALIGKSSFFALNQPSSEFLLPDLSQTLLYYGTNQRPDEAIKGSALFFGIKGTKELQKTLSKEKIYLQQNVKKNSWEFSSLPTPLWIIATLKEDGSVFVQVSMKGPNQKIVRNPENNASFTLQKVPTNVLQQTSSPWKINDFAVDATILGKMGALWYGKDLFVVTYGGTEFKGVDLKECLFFSSGTENAYSIFLAPKDAFIFKDRWEPVHLGKDSMGHPLLFVENITENAIVCSLWPPDGSYPTVLSINRSPKPPITPESCHISLLGARSRREWIIEIDKQRKFAHINDWFLFNNAQWELCNSLEKVDNFVSGKVKGKLLVIDDTEKSGIETILKAKLFDETRSQVLDIKIARQSNLKQQKPPVDPDSDDFETDDYSDESDYSDDYDYSDDSELSDE